MKKFLAYLLILSFLANMPLPAYAQYHDIIMGQNADVPTSSTNTYDINNPINLLPQSDEDLSLSGRAYQEKESQIDPKPKEFIPPEIETIKPEPPIKNEIIELHSPPLNGSVDDFVYGHSVYYNILKKYNRLDLFGKLTYTEQSVSEKTHKNQDFAEKTYEAQDQSVSEEVYDPTEQMLSTMVTQSIADTAWYNTLVGPSVMNGVNNEKYSAWSDMEEIVSPQTGDLTVKQTDLKLPGRNGLDLTIGRIYQSNQSVFGDRKIAGDGTSYNDYSTYYLKRYALGRLGFRFSIRPGGTGGKQKRTLLPHR